MNIIAVSMIRNESDIIETFARYAATVADRIIVLDTGSTDATCEIVRSLISEGLPIELLCEEHLDYAQAATMTRLLHMAASQDPGSLVLPLDADEFLFAVDGGMARETLKSLSPDAVYQVAWTTFVPNPDDDVSEPNVLKRIVHRRAREPDQYYKVIVPAAVSIRNGLGLSQGNHDVTGQKPRPTMRELKNLRLAHYPIRSPEQARSKFLVGWLNYLSMPDRQPGDGAHWEATYTKIRSGNPLGMDELSRLAMGFGAEWRGENVRPPKLVHRPLPLGHFQDFPLRYTQSGQHPAFLNLLDHAERVCRRHARQVQELRGLQAQVDATERLPGTGGDSFHQVLKTVVRNMTRRPRKVFPGSAWIEHMPFAQVLFDIHRPGVFVELGVHEGNSFLVFCERNKSLGGNATCYGVDTWTGDEHSGRYTERVYRELCELVAQNEYDRFSYLLRMTFDEASTYFSDGSVDLLHIDGLHTYEAVRHDFETWLPKMSDRGVILFHDTQVREHGFGVWKLWDEVSRRWPSFNFAHGYGLGVLLVGERIGPDIREIVRMLANEPEFSSAFFSAGRFIKVLESKEGGEALTIQSISRIVTRMVRWLRSYPRLYSATRFIYRFARGARRRLARG